VSRESMTRVSASRQNGQCIDLIHHFLD